MIEKRGNREASPYVLLALGSTLLIAGVLIALVADVPGASGSLILLAALIMGRGAWTLRPQQPLVSDVNSAPTSGISGTQEPHQLEETVDKERQLLLAIRDNGGTITPAEATMHTTLAVKQADMMLSELAKEGHLLVQREGGVLVYALPNRGTTKPY